MSFLAPILFVSALTNFSRGEPAIPQNWEQANAATVRLKPSAFSNVSAQVRGELNRRGCTVPQSYSDKVPHNVVRGHFTSSTQTDLAVLCSKDLISSILVFRGGSTASVVELAKRPDADFLQVVASGGVVGYSRSLSVATPKYIEEHHQRYGGPTPPPLGHDGLNDIFVGKASVVLVLGRWALVAAPGSRLTARSNLLGSQRVTSRAIIVVAPAAERGRSASVGGQIQRDASMGATRG